MTRTIRHLLLSIALISVASQSLAQTPAASEAQMAQADKAFQSGNALMEQRKYAEAFAQYKQALAALPNEPAVLFNGGLAAFSSKEFVVAADWWKQLKTLESSDWHVRAKLIQAYQALGKTKERDAERNELFEMWKSGKPPELKEQPKYCRDQFEVNGKKVMAFELFELKGDRSLRYIFSILNEAEDGEEFRISLGSYNMTNAIWRESRKPTPKEGERLFHLDGYFKNSHATYGMFFPEPTYDETRAKVVQILQGKGSPISSTVYPSPPPDKPKP